MTMKNSTGWNTVLEFFSSSLVVERYFLRLCIYEADVVVVIVVVVVVNHAEVFLKFIFKLINSYSPWLSV